MTKNEIKYYSGLKQKKFRDSENKFLIEGTHLIEECLSSLIYKNSMEKIFIREGFENDVLMKKIKDHKFNIEINLLTEKAFSQLSETVNSQGIIGVVTKQNPGISGNKQESKLIVALDAVNDPGNLGTIIRTCYWFGVDQLLTGENSAELFNSKVIRASQGAIFNLNIKNGVNLEKDLKNYFENDFKIILTDLNTDKILSDVRFNSEEKYLFVFGNEANGIQKNIIENKNYIKLKIKGYSDCESLNISVSAGIVLNTLRNT